MALINWKNGTNGSWSDATQWDLGREPLATDDATIAASANSTYQVELVAGSVAASLTLNDAQAFLVENSAADLAIGGALTLDAGLIELEATSGNSFGSISISGGQLEAADGALGGADVTLSGGELTALNGDISSNISIMGSATIDASAGTTATFGAGGWLINGPAGTTLTFGTSTRNGTVAWSSTGEVSTDYDIDVAFGTLQAANGSNLLEFDAGTTVASGATIDLHGFSTILEGPLSGAGDIVDSADASPTLTLDDGDFTGAIDGDIAVDFGGNTILEGDNTYTGGTTIEAGVQLTVLGPAGVIGGTLADNGELLDESGDVTGVISGSGNLFLSGGVTLDQADTFSGGTTIQDATVTIGSGKAFGTGGVTVTGGFSEIAAATSTTLKNNLTLSATSVAFAVLRDHTLGLAPAALDLTGLANLDFGDSANTGTVLFEAGQVTTAPVSVDVQDGTLKDGNGTLAKVLDAATSVTVNDADATLDLDGFSATLKSLGGGGKLTNSASKLATVVLEGVTDLFGGISGNLTLRLEGGTFTADVADNYTGATAISGAALNVGAATQAFGAGTLTLKNTSLVATGNVTIGNDLVLDGNDSFAETTGKTLELPAGNLSIGDGFTAPSFTFGDSTHKGTIVIGAGGGSTSSIAQVTVAAGTLKNGGQLDQFFDVATNTTIDAGATYDIAGGNLTIPNMLDAGTFTSTTSGAVLDVSGVLDVTGNITGAVDLLVTGGTTTLASRNTYSGGTTVTGGAVTIGNDGAFGSGAVSIANAELIASASLPVGGAITLAGNITLAAAAGSTLNLAGPVDLSETSAPLNFTVGDKLHTGTVILTGVDSVDETNPLNFTVAFGTLKIGSSGFSNAISDATVLDVGAGGVLNLDGFTTQAGTRLEGSGLIGNTGASATFFVDSGDYAGRIGGQIALDIIGELRLSGADTVTGGTTIQGSLVLSGAGAVTGAIADNGSLVVDDGGAVALAGAISGSGGFTQDGFGVTTLSGADGYTGATVIKAGELVASNSAALSGGGAVTLADAEFLATVNMSVSQSLTVFGSSTIAASTGTTLRLATATPTVGGGSLTFGDSAHKGTVVFAASGATLTSAADTFVEIFAGTLQAVGGGLSTLLGTAASTSLDAGATLDIDGRAMSIKGLSGSGKLINSGAKAQLNLTGGFFSGVISGAYSALDISGAVTLDGVQTFTGAANLAKGSVLTLGGQFAEAVNFAGAATLTLTTTKSFTGAVQNFSLDVGVIDLKAITTGASATLSYDTGLKRLTISDGVHEQYISFTGSYVNGNFIASSDKSGGTDIRWQAATAAMAAPALAAVAPRPAAAEPATATPPAPATHAASAVNLMTQAAAAFGGGGGLVGAPYSEPHDRPLLAALALDHRPSPALAC
jgi:fibronectin-binding autotransporter adhesin